MISNTTPPYKLKASKSSRDLHNYSDNHIEENYESENVDEGSIGDTNRKPLVYSSRDGRYKGTRSRQTEFRHSRMGPSERRGYSRGRGGTIPRRDRDFSENYSHGPRKYHDTLSRNPESAGMYYRSKCYEPDKKSEIKFNLPEDTRISKLLRRLSMEGDQENSLAISKKLLEVLLIPDNAHYVRKAFHILGDSMLDILRVAPGMVAKKQATRALGRMGYIMGQEKDFTRFQDWMFNRMSSESDDIRYLFMKALKETLEFESQKHVLQDHAENLIHDLVAMIEVLENATLFKSTLDVLITLVEIYPEEFYTEFRDAIDILLGWHVDLTQPLPNIEFISKSLQRIKKHFQINLDFSTTLVHHFLEDIEACAKELGNERSNILTFKENETNPLNYMTVSILALNTVLKCLGDLLQPASNELVTVKFTTDCMIQIIKTLSSTLEWHIPDNLIIATNENISLLLGILGTKSSALYNSIYDLITLQLSLVNKFSDKIIISMLLMIAKVIKELSANLPLDLVQNLVGPHSQIIKLRYSLFKDVQEATISVYQALLNLKNIPLLQEAYRCVLGDLEVVYKLIVPNLPVLCQNNPFENMSYAIIDDPELAVLFLIRCLSQLANSSGSIIGLWALKPSILELFAVLLEPYNQELSSSTPSLQYSFLYLLYSHCKCYNHFIATSSLVCNKQENGNMMGLLGLPDGLTMGDVTSNSPNSRNFAIILDVLFRTLNTSTSLETMLLLLQWLNDILIHAESYLVNFYNRQEFSKIAVVLVKCGYSYDHRIVLAVSANLKKLLYQKELSWHNAFLISVNELCILHMNSNSKEIRDIYTNLSKNIPWDLTVIQFNKNYSVEQAKLQCTDLNLYNNFTIVMAQHLHLSGSVYGEMLPFQFMTFMKYLLHGEEHLCNWLEDIFICCWPLEYDPQVNAVNMEAFRSLALNSRTILNNWTTFEAAQLCVNSKLRTPLGKPNETFTSFEAVLKQLAKDVMKVKSDSEEQVSTSKIDQKRVRMLLQFMEHLEKSIYNAAEGCAIAMPPTSKPVRTFFHTNASTCKEWLSRIRIVILHVALHAGQSTIALRHGQALLKNLVSSNKGKTVDFERAVMYVTLALLNLREYEAIYGLYTWCKKVADRRFEWVKYAADQANKRYELAAKNYKTILDTNIKSSESEEDSTEINKSKNTKMDIQIQHFVFNQILNCYKELNSWSDVAHWQNQCFAFGQSENGIKYSFTTVDYDCMQALSDVEIVTSFNGLNCWNEQEITDNSWSIYDTIRKTESNLYNIALNIDSPKNDLLLIKVNDSLSIIREGLQDNLLTLPSEFLQTFSLMHYIANGLKTVLNNSLASNVFLVSENFENDIEKIDSTILSKILWWSEYFSRDHNNPGFHSFCSSLRLHIIRRARKEKNFNLALAHINRFLEQEELFKNEASSKIQFTIEEIGNHLLQKTVELSTCSVDVAKSAKESIKLLYATEENKQLVFNLCASASTAIYKNAEMFCNQDMRQISSRILLKLATWLQGSEQNLISLTEMTSPLVKLLMVLPEIGMLENIGTNVIPVNEMAVGKLLQFSVHQCITLAKNWYAFGTWCYRWGRKIVDHNSDITNALLEEDKIAVSECLPMLNEAELIQIVSILSLTVDCNEDDIDLNGLNTAEIIQEELKKLPILYGVHEDQLETLIQIWRKSQKRIYAYYELSADAYFKYLHLVTNSENANKSAECNSITATLRLLRLIVKHAWELQHVLEDGLASTPTHPWKVIIPQLFSRLNHPEAYVRRRVSEFLCRVAEDAPHLITFPAVVGAVEGGVKFDFSEMTMPKDCFSQSNDIIEDTELNEIEDAYESDSEESKSVLQTCFKSMVETLSKQASETITQVQLLVKELRRITLLWDELWLGTLAQYHSEIVQRQHQLEVEIEKVNDNLNLDKDEKISLISEKYRIIMKPIIFILEQLQSVTSVEPETPHEKQFQERYCDVIKEVLEKLKNPDHADKPQESWQPLKLLQSKFQQKAHKRTAYSLKMHDISPLLAGMRDTVIAMPGLTALKTRVTIASVSNHVSILPTKTKPKKLIFHGSDGQTYTYLFKGLEDLHLDERIMQFLSIANTMMAQGNGNSSHNLYRARHYSVIPLGPRSGLISWVDGTTPVFALYKRWQQREAAKANIKSGPGQRSHSNPNTGVLRPSELFYNKLNPLLQEHGVKNPENRKEWPLAILKQVLTELMHETPNDLLAKELWCHSISAGEWWQITRNYSYSVAVMCTIGYIIGLGDRHLDNVLVDLTSGEVVHIDYNVCFEKGKTLRVPEKVPFRLTPNIEEALGITGVEGIFRLACENVLKTMKKGRETLLTLLEAFVYDPLVDWTVGGEGLAGTAFRGVAGSSLTRQSRKDLEKEVTLSMYNVRCTEIRIDWISNRDDILEEIPHTMEKLQMWLNEQQKTSEIEDLLQDLHQQMALVKEAEANGIGNHTLYTLPTRYETYRKRQDAISIAKKELCSLINDTELHIQMYADALKVLEGRQYSQWIMELNMSIDKESCTIFDLVKEFLQNAGQSSMVVQCEQSENDVEQLKQQQTIVTTKCLHLLQEYGNVYMQCPPGYREKHRMFYYSTWSKLLLENNNFSSCNTVYQQFCVFLETFKVKPPIKAVMEFGYLLKVQLTETTALVTKLYEDLSKIKESNSLAEKIYSNANLAVTSFLRCEKDTLNALKYVILIELCKQNKDFINCELSVSRSGNYVLKQGSQKGGDWFLDDLTWHSNNVIEFIAYPLLQQNHIEDTMFLQVVNGMRAVNNVYKSLQELYYSFHTIILPESMKKILNEEPTVIQTITEINNLVLSVGTPLPELVTCLEKQLTCIVMEMEVSSSHTYVMEMVSQLKARYQIMVLPQSEDLSQGKMLLMGFNGLFDKLNVEFKNLINTLSTLEIPLCWRKVDQVKQARNLAAPIYNTKVKAVLDDIFLLKRIQTMHEYFSLSFEMSNSFKNPTSVVVYNDGHLDKPVKKFILDFVTRQFLGIATETVAYTVCILLQNLGLNVTSEIEQKDIGAENKVSLDELNKKAGNMFLKQGVFTQNTLAQASSLQTNLKTSWNIIQDIRQKEQRLAIMQNSLERLQNQYTSHNWLHENTLFSHNAMGINTTLERSTFIHDLKNDTSNLKTLLHKINEAREQQKILVASVNSRLNWAAGVNPDVNQVLSAFENAVSTRESQLEVEQQIANLVFKTCNSILQHEQTRTQTPEGEALDKRFLSTWNKWQNIFKLKSPKHDEVTLTEENIMKLCNIEITDTNWVLKISEKLSEVITSSQKQLNEQKENMFVASDAIHLCIGKLKSYFTTHNKLMLEVKSLIKSMAKIEECSKDTQEFMVNYRSYMDNFSPLLHCFKKEINCEDVMVIIKHLTYLQENTEHLYDSLINLEGRNGSRGYSRPPLVRQEGMSLSPMKMLPVKQDSVTKGQQRNAYAMGVWRRVRLKLEGRDPDPGKKYSNQEQVDYIIREASSLDNLALMYEGWTPWV